jgi:predicted lipoprotein with Yx(FWY)xxD motif
MLRLRILMVAVMLLSLVVALLPVMAVTPSALAASPAISVTKSAKLGDILTDENGMTLYLFKNDKAGQSACTGSCAQTWPAFTVSLGETASVGSGISGKVETIKRPDGTMQVAYNKMPLYRYSGDSKAGDANGQGIGGVWYAATPTGAAKTATMAKKSPSKSSSSYGSSSGYGSYGGYGMSGGMYGGYGMYGGGYGMYGGYGYGCGCMPYYGYGYSMRPYFSQPFRFYGGMMMRRY